MNLIWKDYSKISEEYSRSNPGDICKAEVSVNNSRLNATEIIYFEVLSVTGKDYVWIKALPNVHLTKVHGIKTDDKFLLNRRKLTLVTKAK